MDHILPTLLALIPAPSIFLVIIFIAALNPEKAEKWLAILSKLLSRFDGLFKQAHKNYVKYDLQGRVNTFTRSLDDSAPFLAAHKVEVQWVDGEVTKESFLKSYKVIIRLKRDDPEEMNFVIGAYAFVSNSLLYHTKKY